MFKTKQLEELRCVDICTVEKETLPDISRIVLDTSVPQSERLEHVLQSVKNPYCFRYGDMGIKIEFSENTPTLQETFSSFLIKQKSGI